MYSLEISAVQYKRKNISLWLQIIFQLVEYERKKTFVQYNIKKSEFIYFDNHTKNHYTWKFFRRNSKKKRTSSESKHYSKMQNMPKLPPLCSPSSDRYSKYNNNLILPKSQPHQQILSPNSPQSILPQPFSVMHHLNHQSDLNEEPNMKKHIMNVHNQNQFIGVGSYGRKDWLA